MKRLQYYLLKQELFDKGKGIISNIKKNGNYITIYHNDSKGTDIVRKIIESEKMSDWKCNIDNLEYSNHINTPYGDIIFAKHLNTHEYSKYKIWEP